MDLTSFIFGTYLVGMLGTFSWGFIQFRLSDDLWDRVGDTIWHAHRNAARRMLLAPLWPLLVFRFVLVIVARALTIVASFLLDVFHVARLKA